MVALKHKSVTPIVNVVGAGGTIGAVATTGAGAGASPSTGAAAGAAGAGGADRRPTGSGLPRIGAAGARRRRGEGAAGDPAAGA